MSVITSNININKHKNKNIMKTKKTNTKNTTSTNKQFNITTYSIKNTEVKNIKLLFGKSKPKKETRKNTFNADSTSGYRYYDRNQDGVLHGGTGTMTGNMDDVEFYSQQYIELKRDKFVKYKGKSTSWYEQMVGMALYLYFMNEKNIDISFHQPIGCRPGSNKSLEADYIIFTKTGDWKMFVDVNGGQSRDGERNIFHGAGKKTDAYKRKNYKKLGFDAMVVVNVYDNGGNTDTEQFRVYNKYDSTQYKMTRCMTEQALKNSIMDVLKPLEKAKLIVFDRKKFINCCHGAYSTIRAEMQRVKQCEMVIFKK